LGRAEPAAGDVVLGRNLGAGRAVCASVTLNDNNIPICIADLCW
jgi:hypothetical protein